MSGDRDIVQKNTEVSKKQPNRGQWTNQLDFFLSCLGYAVGLGNVWRFPYLCYRNGGGAFLIPYVCMLAICGLPTFFMELVLGQYHGRGANIIFKHLATAFQGLGYAMLIVNLLVCLYYNMIIAWTLFYLFSSFTSQLGWEFCGNSWNTPSCFNTRQNADCEAKNMTYWNNTCADIQTFCADFNASQVNQTHCEQNDGTLIAANNAPNRIVPSEDYYLHYMLGVSPTIDAFGEIRWQLVLCLLGAWIIVALCLIKGVRSSGKVVYFTALFPYVVLLILLIRGATLEGAAEGIKFYIVPKWDKIMYAQAWGDAAVQIFYSLGPGFGGLLTLASYNRFHNNCYRDAIIIAVSNCATSVFAGFVIFSILGFMAHTLNMPVDKVVKSGPGLAFIAYPEAVTKMPLSQIWAFLFFLMLVTLGLDSQFAMCETLITAVHDLWPQMRKKNSLIVVAVCVICFLLGLPLCARGGVYLFTLMDWYSAGWSLLIIALCEIILVSWIYGVENFKKNIEEMIGHEPNLYWILCWKYISPVTMFGILIFTFVNYSPASFGTYVLPLWSNALGWMMAFSSVIMIPLFMIYQLWKTHSQGQPLSSAFRPTAKWGPAEKRASKTQDTLELPPTDVGIRNEAFVEDEKK